MAWNNSLRSITLPLSIFLLFACKQQTSPTSGTSGLDKNVPLTYSHLIGKRLECQTPGGKADVYMAAPHFLAIMSGEPDTILEYYRTDFLTKEGELFYQLAYFGRGDYKTKAVAFDDMKNRRLRLTIKEGKIRILVAHGLDEKRNPINPSEMSCSIAGVLENFFVPPALKGTPEQAEPATK